MLYVFDLDDTLIRGYLTEPRIPYEQVEVLPRRREFLAQLTERGHQIAIATNQAGVAFGFISEDEVHDKIRRSIQALGLPEDTPCAVCFAHPKSRDARYSDPAEVVRRKPSGRMIRELMEQTGQFLVPYFVGDREEDRLAAEDAGVRFADAETFFAE
jgi:D-glycero-D-manno-heptose 1,7-bisphosphate phosphatase